MGPRGLKILVAVISVLWMSRKPRCAERWSPRHVRATGVVVRHAPGGNIDSCHEKGERAKQGRLPGRIATDDNRERCKVELERAITTEVEEFERLDHQRF